MVTLTVQAIDAETDKAIGPFVHNGQTVNLCLVVLPVGGTPLPTADDALAAIAALESDPNNAPIPVGGPEQKPVIGTPGFADFAPSLGAQPFIVRVDGLLSLDLGSLSASVQGWWVGVIPVESDAYEFEPLVAFIEGDDDLTIYGYRHDLSPLAREVAEKRAAAKRELDKLGPQWGGVGAPIPSVVVDMVHAYIENSLPPKDPRLAAYWINDLSWAVMDFAIPAREFDLLVDRYAVLVGIVGEVPWPDLPYFERCALGVPLTMGKDGKPLTPLNWRICVPTFSDYFPREANQIRTDVGGLWLANLGMVFACVVKKIQEKIKEAEKSAKFWKVAGFALSIIFLPNPATIISSIVDEVKSWLLKNACASPEDQSKWFCNPALTVGLDWASGQVTALVTGGYVAGAFEGLTVKVFGMATQYVAKALELQGTLDLVEAAKAAEQLAALDGEMQAANALGAVAAIGENVTAEDLLKLAQEGASFEAFVAKALGLDTMPPALLPFLVWCIGVTGTGILLRSIFELAKEIGALLGDLWANVPSVDPQNDITFPMLNAAEAAGVAVPQSVNDLANGLYGAYPQQAVTAAGSAVSAGGTVLGLAGIGYLVLKGIVR